MLDTGLPTVPAHRLYLVRSDEPRLIPKELLKLVLRPVPLYRIWYCVQLCSRKYELEQLLRDQPRIIGTDQVQSMWLVLLAIRYPASTPIGI